MGGIGIIHNPFAKGNLKRPWIAEKLKGLVRDVGVFRETKNVEELTDVAAEFMDQKIEVMAVNGGDGTLHLALSAFVKVYGDQRLPKLMSLRGGTMNTMSTSLKIKGKTLDIVKKAVAKFKSGEPFSECEQHLLKVNDKYGFMSGAGAIAKFLDAYYSGTTTGPWQATKVVSKMVGGAILRTEFTKELFRPVHFKIFVDGAEKDPEEYSFILACTITEVGLGFKATPRAYDKPGHFHFVASTIKPLNLAPYVPSIWMGKDLDHPGFAHNGVTKEAVVEPRGMFRWMLDGEMYDAEEPLHYSVGPNITIAVP